MVWKSKPVASAVVRQSSRSGQAMRCIGALTAAVHMAIPVEAMRRAAESAVAGAADFYRAAIRVADHDRDPSGAAIAAPHETHRYRADGRGAHHRQNNPARSFHGALPAMRDIDHSGMRVWFRQVKLRQANLNFGPQPPPEKCDANARANPPKPPRVTWP